MTQEKAMSIGIGTASVVNGLAYPEVGHCRFSFREKTAVFGLVQFSV